MLLAYIKFKPVKLVEDLQDVRSKSNLNLAGRYTISIYAPDLLKRAEIYKKSMNIGNTSFISTINFITINMLKDILNGETVVLANSVAIENMIIVILWVIIW